MSSLDPFDPNADTRNQVKCHERDIAYLKAVVDRAGLSRFAPLMDQSTQRQPWLTLTFLKPDGRSLTIHDRMSSGDEQALEQFEVRIMAEPGSRKGTVRARLNPIMLGETWCWRK